MACDRLRIRGLAESGDAVCAQAAKASAAAAIKLKRRAVLINILIWRGVFCRCREYIARKKTLPQPEDFSGFQRHIGPGKSWNDSRGVVGSGPVCRYVEGI